MAKKRRKVGLPPGTIDYTGKKYDLEIKVTYCEYDHEDFKSTVVEDLKTSHIRPSNVEQIQWYDIRGLHDEAFLRAIGENFGIHPLAMEDVADIYKRPEYTDYITGHFICFKSLDFINNELTVQNISLYFNEGFVLTFQEHEDDVFRSLRDRLKIKESRIRSRGSDYLAYAIIDLIVDNYFKVIDSIEDRIEQLEVMIIENVDGFNKNELFNVKKDLLKARKILVPLREALSQFSRSESKIIEEKTSYFVKDLYDHAIQLTDNLDSLRDIVSGLQDLYLSELSMKMNGIMQSLTIITAIFVPLSFLAGLYGMNFEYIPELGYKYGYFVLIGVMIVIAIGLVVLFKRRKWF